MSFKNWCAMCGTWGDHTSGDCPENMKPSKEKLYGPSSAEDGARFAVKCPTGSKRYFLMTPGSIMQKVPNPGRFENRDTNATENFSCWLMSKLVNPDPNNPTTWADIESKARLIAGTDSDLFVSMVADVLERWRDRLAVLREA